MAKKNKDFKDLADRMLSGTEEASPSAHRKQAQPKANTSTTKPRISRIKRALQPVQENEQVKVLSRPNVEHSTSPQLTLPGFPAATPTARPTRPKREAKTKRLALLIRPSTFIKLDKIAYMRDSSLNDLINHVLEDFAITQADVIEKYDKEVTE